MLLSSYVSFWTSFKNSNKRDDGQNVKDTAMGFIARGADGLLSTVNSCLTLSAYEHITAAATPPQFGPVRSPCCLGVHALEKKTAHWAIAVLSTNAVTLPTEPQLQPRKLVNILHDCLER